MHYCCLDSEVLRCMMVVNVEQRGRWIHTWIWWTQLLEINGVEAWGFVRILLGWIILR